MLYRDHHALKLPLFTSNISALRTQRTMATEARQEAKNALRSEIKTRLSSLTEDSITLQSEKAQNVILSLPQYKQASGVGIYLSMPKAEAQTDILVRDALEGGKAVFVPHIYAVGAEKPKRKVMDMLRLSSLGEYEGLEKDSWGIPKLSKEGREGRDGRANGMGGFGLSLNTEDGSVKEMSEVSGLDLIVVPGVAFDPEMNRMGHGAAFYDTFLARLCEGGKRKKPFLGTSATWPQSSLLKLTSFSWLVPRRTDIAIRTAGHAGLGLESRRSRRRRWKFADFEGRSMSISILRANCMLGLLTLASSPTSPLLGDALLSVTRGLLER